MNTYSSIIASVVATFAVSALSNKEGKLHIDHIQNAVLAGGVSIGEHIKIFDPIIINEFACLFV